MIYMQRLSLLLQCLLSFVYSAVAQMHTSSYGIKQGLPDNTVNCIAQDNRGFVWTGTSNGLAQFDGLFFRLFRYSNTNTTTISNNNVHSLLSTDAGMYVASDFGVDFYSYSATSAFIAVRL